MKANNTLKKSNFPMTYITTLSIKPQSYFYTNTNDLMIDQF